MIRFLAGLPVTFVRPESRIQWKLANHSLNQVFSNFALLMSWIDNFFFGRYGAVVCFVRWLAETLAFTY